LGIDKVASESLRLFDFAKNLLEQIVNDYDFPQHTLIRVWGRQDVAMVSFSRQLYKWESSLMEKITTPSGLAVIQNHLNLLTRARLFADWAKFVDVPVRNAYSFRRFYVSGTQYGRSIVVFDKPVFPERLVWDRGWIHPGNQSLVDSVPENEYMAGREEKINQLYRRALKNQLGRGAQKSFVQILDSRNYLFYAAGILTDGQRTIAQEDDGSKKSVSYVIERCILNAMRDVFAEEELEQNPYTDVQVVLATDEAFGILTL